MIKGTHGYNKHVLCVSVDVISCVWHIYVFIILTVLAHHPNLCLLTPILARSAHTPRLAHASPRTRAASGCAHLPRFASRFANSRSANSPPCTLPRSASQTWVMRFISVAIFSFSSSSRVTSMLLSAPSCWFAAVSSRTIPSLVSSMARTRSSSLFKSFTSCSRSSRVPLSAPLRFARPSSSTRCSSRARSAACRESSAVFDAESLLYWSVSSSCSLRYLSFQRATSRPSAAEPPPPPAPPAAWCSRMIFSLFSAAFSFWTERSLERRFLSGWRGEEGVRCVCV